MKETINYYYNVFPVKIYDIKMGCYFYFNNVKYYFIKYSEDINHIDTWVKISNDLYNKNILVDTFIKNKYNTYYVDFDEEKYVLLRVNSIENDIFTLNDIIYFNNLLVANETNTMHLDWATIWMKKIDDYENEISEFNYEYPILRESSDYYIGLAENAVSYFKDTVIEEDMRSVKINLNHRRIKSKPYSGYINNPLTFTFDYEVRDIAEYIKSSFFEGDFHEEDFYKIINKNYSKASLRLLFSRLLYPNYYFGIVEEILVEEIDELKLKKYVDLIDEYERFLFKIYEIINRRVPIPVVEWLISKK